MGGSSRAWGAVPGARSGGGKSDHSTGAFCNLSTMPLSPPLPRALVAGILLAPLAGCANQRPATEAPRDTEVVKGTPQAPAPASPPTPRPSTKASDPHSVLLVLGPSPLSDQEWRSRATVPAGATVTLVVSPAVFAGELLRVIDLLQQAGITRPRIALEVTASEPLDGVAVELRAAVGPADIEISPRGDWSVRGGWPQPEREARSLLEKLRPVIADGVLSVSSRAPSAAVVPAARELQAPEHVVVLTRPPAPLPAGGPSRAKTTSADWRCPFPANVDDDSADVAIIVKVDAEGWARSVRVLEATPSTFRDAAYECAMQARYRPARDAEGRAAVGETDRIVVKFLR